MTRPSGVYTRPYISVKNISEKILIAVTTSFEVGDANEDTTDALNFMPGPYLPLPMPGPSERIFVFEKLS